MLLSLFVLMFAPHTHAPHIFAYIVFIWMNGRLPRYTHAEKKYDYLCHSRLGQHLCSYVMMIIRRLYHIDLCLTGNWDIYGNNYYYVFIAVLHASRPLAPHQKNLYNVCGDI